MDARYRGVVYGLDVLDHETGLLVENDYVGKTRQKGRARENQHRDTQPFSDRIVGSARVLWEGMCTEAELDEMERRFIQEPPSGVRPRLNYLLNEDNPHQIPKWVQVEQRHERDDAAGRPRWLPADERRRDSLLDWDGGQPIARPPAAVRRVPWSSRRKHLTGLAIGWAALTFAAWIVLAVKNVFTQTNMLAAIPAALVFEVWVWAGVPLPFWRWSRRSAARRVRKRLQKGRRR
ncbi:hypothetical protein AB0F72_08880 [Actinoplanes sp. NPDC023936]|uniref:hypothetical protein n=1 Tax=Actinoplanes sp. NPDC023936 TaxID=3154910 RepID=UPI0033F3C399